MPELAELSLEPSSVQLLAQQSLYHLRVFPTVPQLSANSGWGWKKPLVQPWLACCVQNKLSHSSSLRLSSSSYPLLGDIGPCMAQKGCALRVRGRPQVRVSWAHKNATCRAPSHGEVGFLRKIWGTVWGGDTKDSEGRTGYVWSPVQTENVGLLFKTEEQGC